MTRGLLLMTMSLLSGCGGEPQRNGSEAVNEAAAEQPANQCTPPKLAMDDVARPVGSEWLDETEANFAAAFNRACAKGLLKDEALIDPKAVDKSNLFLINAPEANVASIYLSEVDANRMVLEYPFLTTDGKTQVPSAEELEEAIYCAVHGATPEEQESSGRCLVD